MHLLQTTLVCFSILLPLTAAAQEAQLTPEAVNSIWVGRIAIGTTTKGTPVELRLRADGTASVVAGSTADTGTWRTFEKGFCTTWKTIRSNQERCFTGVTKGSITTMFNPDGSNAGQYTEFK